MPLGKTQETIQNERAKYIKGELTYNQYYTWLAKYLHIPESLIPVSDHTLIESKDPENFNDITLATWDRQHNILLASILAPGGGGSISWSLSDSVCVLKTLAYNRRNRLTNTVN
jgi:hypothetical protein